MAVAEEMRTGTKEVVAADVGEAVTDARAVTTHARAAKTCARMAETAAKVVRAGGRSGEHGR